MKMIMKKSLVVVLIITMTFVFSVSVSFAGESKPAINYVSIGSSTATGYGLASYTSNNHYGSGVDWTNQEDTSQIPYIEKFKRELAETNDVSFTNLCYEGMRTNELRAILDESYYNRFIGSKLNPRSDAFLTQHLECWTDNTPKNGGGNINSYTDIHNYFKGAIENADVITFDACENTFGTYLVYRLLGILNPNGLTTYGAYSRKSGYKYGDLDNYIKGYYDQTITDLTDIPLELRWMLPLIEKEARELLENVDADLFEEDGMIDRLVDTLLYCAVSCCLNFSADVQMIYEMNPDVDLVVFGVSNPIDNSWFALNDQIKIDLGKIVQIYLDTVNTYVKFIDKNSEKYYFADCGNWNTFFKDSDEANEIYGSKSKPIPFDSLLVDIQDPDVLTFMSGNDPEENITLKNGSTIKRKDFPQSEHPFAQYIFVRFAYEIGKYSHPSSIGHQQKFEAAWKAYTEKVPYKTAVYKKAKKAYERAVTIGTIMYNGWKTVNAFVENIKDFYDSFFHSTDRNRLNSNPEPLKLAPIEESIEDEALEEEFTGLLTKSVSVAPLNQVEENIEEDKPENVEPPEEVKKPVESAAPLMTSGAAIEKPEAAAVSADIISDESNKDAEKTIDNEEVTNDEIIQDIKTAVVESSSKISKTKNGKKGIKISWNLTNDYGVDYYQVWRSTSRTSGFEKIYTTKTGDIKSYVNTKGLTKGKKYYYKVRGIKIVDGEKYYTDWSKKAIRTFK